LVSPLSPPDLFVTPHTTPPRLPADNQYCIECAKYYESALALATHTRSKVHKRRIKDLKGGAYTLEESQRAMGRTAPDNRQRGVEDVVRRFEATTVDALVPKKGPGHVMPAESAAVL
jgi:hypothetical protein